jgi:hypothetical protein
MTLTTTTPPAGRRMICNFQVNPGESPVTALARKEKEIIRLGGSWRIPTSNRSLGRENIEAQLELDKLAFLYGEEGRAFPSVVQNKPQATPAPALTRQQLKDGFWAAHARLSSTQKQKFYQDHRAQMD